MCVTIIYLSITSSKLPCTPLILERKASSKALLHRERRPHSENSGRKVAGMDFFCDFSLREGLRQVCSPPLGSNKAFLIENDILGHVTATKDGEKGGEERR